MILGAKLNRLGQEVKERDARDRARGEAEDEVELIAEPEREPPPTKVATDAATATYRTVITELFQSGIYGGLEVRIGIRALDDLRADDK